MNEPRYYEGAGAYEIFGWKGTPAPPVPVEEDESRLDCWPDTAERAHPNPEGFALFFGKTGDDFDE